MNILFYCPLVINLNDIRNYPLGGIESLNIELAKEIAKTKHKVYLASFTKKAFSKDNVLNIPIKNILNKHNQYSFDMIISSNDPSIFEKYKNSKKFFWMHNTLSLEKSLRKRKLLPLLTNKITTIFVSKYLRNITSRLYLFNKNIVIPNFLSQQFTSIKINSKRKPIFVWSVQREKGLKETIQTWIDQIYPIDNKAKLYVLGINKMPNWFKSKSFQKKNIQFFCRISKNKLKEIYQKSMGMICLGYDETFCLNALEANSCGLPVITFGKTALNEMIIDKKNGFIINDFDDLEKKINYIINLKKTKN